MDILIGIFASLSAGLWMYDLTGGDHLSLALLAALSVGAVSWACVEALEFDRRINKW